MKWEADKKMKEADDKEHVLGIYEAYGALKAEAEKRLEEKDRAWNHEHSLYEEARKRNVELEGERAMDHKKIAAYEEALVNQEALNRDMLAAAVNSSDDLLKEKAALEATFKLLKEKYCPLLDGEFSCGSPTACPKCLLNFKLPAEGKPAEVKGVLPGPETPEGRCKRCGWPLVVDPKDGCTKDNCSMRPLPPKRTPEAP